MGKKIDKIIMDDFNESYKIDLDKEKIYKSIQINKSQKLDKEDKTWETILKLKLLCKRLSICLSILVVCLIVVIGISIFDNQRKTPQDEILTEEFKEYMVEYSGIRNCKLYSFLINDNLELCIYECEDTKDNTNYYFYKVKVNYDTNKSFLFINNQKIELINESYGLLCEIQKDQEITFSIDKNGIITDYKIK